MNTPADEGAPALDMIRGTADIAKFLGVGQQEVLRLVHAGELPYLVLGRTICVPRDMLTEWVYDGARAQQKYNREALERMRRAGAAQ